jgi:hypothetical protein
VISASLLGGAAALSRLGAMRDAANREIARTIAKLGIDLQNNVKQDKLSGQVLKIRSGALQQSVAVRIDQSDTKVSATVFSDIDYAAAQEYGFTGTVNVRASLRQIKEAYGHPITEKTINVRAHSRGMNLPERSFLRSALDEMAPDISAGVQDALRGALS